MTRVPTAQPRTRPTAVGPRPTPAGEVVVHDRFGPVRDEWRSLAARVGASPFARPGWLEAWWRAFGSGELELYCLHRDGELAGVLPLARDGGVLSALANEHTPSFEIAAADRAAAAELIGAAVARAPRRLELVEVDADGPLAAAVASATTARHHPLRQRVTRRAPYTLTGPGSEHPVDRLPKKRRSRIRNLRRKLEREGPVRIEVLRGGDELGAALAWAFAIEATGWKAEEGTAIASDEATLRFYSEVSRWAADERMLALTFLFVGERPVAFFLDFVFGGTVYGLKSGIDAAFRAQGPGIVLLAESLADAHAGEIDVIEMCGDANPYKLEFADGTRTIVKQQIFPRTISGRASWFNQRYARPVARRLARAAAAR